MAEISGEIKGEGKVMVAIDESEESYYALLWVLENLKKPMVILAVQPPLNYNNSYAASLGSARMYTVSSTPELANSIHEQHHKVSLGLLEKAKSICASKGVNAETQIEIGDSKVAICNAVQKYNISLLVVAHREMGKLKRALIWNVSHYCIQYAKCPVLVVKKPE